MKQTREGRELRLPRKLREGRGREGERKEKETKKEGRKEDRGWRGWRADRPGTWPSGLELVGRTGPEAGWKSEQATLPDRPMALVGAVWGPWGAGRGEGGGGKSGWKESDLNVRVGWTHTSLV